MYDTHKNAHVQRPRGVDVMNHDPGKKQLETVHRTLSYEDQLVYTF